MPTPSSDKQQKHHQGISVFGVILERLVEASPGALGAVLADEEGECVDWFSEGDGDPDDLKLAAAYMGIMLNRTATPKIQRLSGYLQELRIRGAKAQYVGRALGLGYQVTVVLTPTATLPKLDAALERAVVELRLEAGGVLN